MKINASHANLLCMSAQQRNATAIDWSDIYFAYQVARTGTLSAAAAVLDVHHSTVLRRINALEQRLNSRLFYRHPRGYTPTEAGKLLLATANRSQDNFNRLIGQLMSSGEELAGSIIITSVNSVSMHITPFFGKFQQKYPNIHLNYGSNTQIAKLEYGEAHISLRYGAKPTEPDYIVQNLIQLPATLYASASYIEKYGRMKNVCDIVGHRFISTLKNYENIRFIDWLHKAIPEGQICYRTSDYSSMLAAVTAGMGIAPIERWIDNSRKDLIPLFESPEDWTNNLWLTTHRDAHNTPKIQAFTQFLKEELSNINLR